MITALISRLIILALGTLYPAYASYKAVRTKDVKEYVKWMMYWIVFALFTCAETFTDVLFSFWFPFYYEIKVAIVLWLLSPATKGSSFLYRNFVHPAFLKRESEIDEMLAKAKERGYSTVVSLGSKGVSYATNVILQTAMKGGGGLVEHIKKSYSLSDLAPPRRGDRFIRPDETDVGQVREEDDEVPERPLLRRRPIASPGIDMKFNEIDVSMRQLQASSGPLGDIQSTEDISSGYSSTDQLYMGQSEMMLTRSSSVTRGRGRSARVNQPKKIPLTEETEESDQGYEVFFQSYPYPPESYGVTSDIKRFSFQSPNEDTQPKVKDLSTIFETQSSSFSEKSFSALSCNSQSSIGSFSSDKSDRKGKYGKYQAPKPPSRDVFPENYRAQDSCLSFDKNYDPFDKYSPSSDESNSEIKRDSSIRSTVTEKVLIYTQNDRISGQEDTSDLIDLNTKGEKPFETFV